MPALLDPPRRAMAPRTLPPAEPEPLLGAFRTPERRTCHTLVISDLHLGSDVCRADKILEVLRSWNFRQLVILGDAFDDLRFRRLRRSHFKVLSRINKLSGRRRGVRVVWVEGNHDATFLNVVSAMLGMEVHREFLCTVGSRRYLLVHGHQFDRFIEKNPVFTDVMSWLYLMIQRRDTRTMAISRYVKKKSKLWLRLSDRQAAKAIALARERGADAILCGHTHIPGIRRTPNGIQYVNTGCWTDSPSHYATIDESGVTLHECP